MAEAAILVPPSSSVDLEGFTFDAVLSERYQGSAQATRYAREDGAQGADHKIENPDVISIDALLTDTPFGSEQAQAGRAEVQFAALWALLKSEEPFTFVSSFVSGEFLLVGLNAEQNERTGYSIPVQLQLEEVFIAYTEFVVVPVDHSVSGSGKLQDEGKRVGKEVDESEKSSVLYDLFFG